MYDCKPDKKLKTGGISPEMWDTMRNQFPAKQTNDNMFIEDISDIVKTSH
jgi:hypothetical protein